MAHFTLVRIEMMVASIPYTAQLEIIEHNESASQRLPLPAPPPRKRSALKRGGEGLGVGHPHL